ncbi:MAG: lysylphosphatidylglycerol synthase domain-containing protein, partial [Gaiellaceae bacterium]
LFLVILVPFTPNAIGVREAFFIAFMGRFGIDADPAFATSLLFYAVTVATALPGAIILLWRSLKPLFMRARGVSS